MFGRRLHLFRGRACRANVRSCICPICGYNIVHERGVPCRSIICPKCHVALIPDDQVVETIIGEKVESKESVKRNNTIREFPVINNDLCVGCGSCVDICPKGAIQVIDGIAVINRDKCKKCRICVNACPVDAIS